MFVSPVHETARRASSSVSISEIDFALPFVGVNVSNSLPRLAVETAFFCESLNLNTLHAILTVFNRPIFSYSDSLIHLHDVRPNTCPGLVLLTNRLSDEQEYEVLLEE